MPLQTESRTVFNRSPGTVTTIINLIPKDQFSSGSAAHLTGGQVRSMDELLSPGAPDLVIHNPYTGHDETYAIDVIRAHFAGHDLANAMLQIEIRFVPDNKVGGYPSEMVDELRSSRSSRFLRCLIIVFVVALVTSMVLFLIFIAILNGPWPGLP